MVQMTSGILGAVAATLAFGAVHLEVAAGNDLLGPRRLVSQGSFRDAAQRVAEPNAFGVNRAAKTDRAGVPVLPASESVTLSFSLANTPATSIITRVPVKDAGAGAPPLVAPPAADNSQAKNIAPRGTRMVACEPSVSTLTQVARQLGPSRCVT